MIIQTGRRLFGMTELHSTKSLSLDDGLISDMVLVSQPLQHAV